MSGILHTPPWDMPGYEEYNKEIVTEFHHYWHDLPNKKPYTTWDGVYWRGYKVTKSPSDLLLYAMLIHELRPKHIIETGSGHGGSAFFFWEMGRCNVISVDNRPYDPEWPSDNPRIMFWHSIDSTDPKLNEYFANEFNKAGYGPLPILVSLDSDHHYSHVLAELDFYSRFATYIVVEDCELDGVLEDPEYMNPVWAPNQRNGPNTAVTNWLMLHGDEWEEEIKDQFLFTSNRWLKRK